MRIVMLAVGTLGDVQPYIALGLGLQTAGHQVCLATHDAFREEVTSRGLDFSSIGVNVQQWTADGKIQTLVDAGRDFWRWARHLAHLASPFMDRLMADSWRACQGADAIIYSPLGCVGSCIAERLEVPCYAAFLEPVSRTRAFPMPWLSAPVDLGGMYNWLTYLFAEQAFWQPLRRPVNRWRQEALHLPPIPLAGPFGASNWRRQPFLYGYSPSVLPRPADWPGWVHVTGYWFLDCARDWRPPQGVVDFLASGPPPVYVGFGSVPERSPEALTALVVEALARVGRRGVLHAGWGSLSDIHVSDQLLQIGRVPHHWLFPQMAAVVHHGGAATTATALRAGVPSVIVPFAWDQPFWGQRVADMGVAPLPIPRKRLSAERLAAAIHTAITDEGMRARASALGRQIRAEDGVRQAVAAFYDHLPQEKVVGRVPVRSKIG